MPTLHWNTRNADIRAAARAPFCAMSAVREAYGDAKAQNLLVQGDNLLVLKALVPHYAGAVKCVFIDPPYNTRKDFPHYQDNLEHAQWLEMMHPRLVLLRELLADNGSIWVIIDDDEAHYLKVLMDEIFGRKNFVANVVWQKKFSPQNDAKWFSDNHDHILVYAKNKTRWKINLLPRGDTALERYTNPDNDPRGVWTSSDFSVKSYTAEYDYPITVPSGRIVHPAKSRCWCTSESNFRAFVKDNRIWFGLRGNNKPRMKTFLSEVKDGVTSVTVWLHEEVGNNQDAKKEVKAFNLTSVFTTPKPERLIRRALQLATQPGDIVLDSFLGSGTTAAVAHKMGRRWIGIEMGEHAETHCIPRLRVVVDGKDSGGVTDAAEWKGGGGFHFLRLGGPVFSDDGKINSSVKFPALAAHVWFAETRTPLSLRAGEGPFLGVHKGVGYALLYNGILKDKRVNGGNVLIHPILSHCREAARARGLSDSGRLVIYGNSCKLQKKTLQSANAVFRQTPYELKTR